MGVTPRRPEFYRDLWAFESTTIPHYRINDPMKAIRANIHNLNQISDFIIVAGRISPYMARELAREFPFIDVIISDSPHTLLTRDRDLQGGYYEFYDTNGFIEKTLLIHSSMRAYGIEMVSLNLDNQSNIKSWVLLSRLLDNSVDDNYAIRSILNEFYHSIESNTSYWSSYDRRFEWAIEEQDVVRLENAYLGYETCIPCHSTVVEKWQQTKPA